MTLPISHGFVLPEKNFEDWLRNGVMDYMNAFERVAVIRSPAGNDLNRFRNITAVQTPGVWFGDDALKHIRRAYPMVVLVDVIKVNTPGELKSVLQKRIAAKDRFGTTMNTDNHLHERFALEWPSEARPARITRTFKKDGADKYPGIDILTYSGSKILAGTPGVVSNITQYPTGVSVQITSHAEGQQYITSFYALGKSNVRLQQIVAADTEIATAAGDTVTVVVQSPGNGISGFTVPDVIDPTLLIYWQGLRVRSTVTSLRVRDAPGTHGEVLGTISPDDAIETEEVHGRTLAKLGVEGEWLRIRRAGSRDAYTAAWLLEAFGVDDPPEGLPGIAIPGMNIDIDNPISIPNAAVFQNLGSVRMKFNVSFDPRKHGSDRYGNVDVDYTYSRYLPHIKRYADAGVRTVLVLNHQTFGEGQGYVWPQMNTASWRDLTTKFTAMVRVIAQKFAGSGQILAYQIWNEQDTKPENARAAVPIPAADYGYLLSETIKAIRSVDTQTRIITGGLVGGPDAGPAYIQHAFSVMPGGIRPDGVALHPYGRGPVGDMFSNFGSVAESVQKYSNVLPGKPIWITEWGVLDRQHQPELAPQVSDYVKGFLKIVRDQYPGQVATAIWYAWADGMDNGYGIVRQDGSPKQPLYDTYLR